MQEPFRCTACGAASATATRCPQCGGGAFELVRVPARPDADEGQVAELVSLQAARAERSGRDPEANRD